MKIQDEIGKIVRALCFGELSLAIAVDVILSIVEKHRGELNCPCKDLHDQITRLKAELAQCQDCSGYCFFLKQEIKRLKAKRRVR